MYLNIQGKWFVRVELTTLVELNATRLDIGISYLLSQIYCVQMQFDLNIDINYIELLAK